MLCFLGLIALCPFLSAQSRLEIRGTDTSAVIPIQQLRMANAKFIELRQCQEEQDSLQSQIRIYTGMANNLRASISDMKEGNRLNEAIIGNQKKELDISDQQLKKATRKEKSLKLQRNSIAGIFIAVLIKIAFFK